jgi:cytochrome c oxidase subunit 1
VLFQHFFWFYSHPVVYVMVLPAFGIMSETITVHSRKHIFGYTAIAASSVAIAAVGFIIWGHHMFVSGQSELSGTVFSLLTFAVAIPTAIKLCSWIATLYKGSIQWNSPMLYSLGFLWIFAIGGLTGLFLSTLATDVHLHDTYFVVAHFHYVMMGGTVIAFYAGLHYWWPKMFGVMYREGPAKFSAIIVFIGFNATFFTQFVLGTRGMPRRHAAAVAAARGGGALPPPTPGRRRRGGGRRRAGTRRGGRTFVDRVQGVLRLVGKVGGAVARGRHGRGRAGGLLLGVDGGFGGVIWG